MKREGRNARSVMLLYFCELGFVDNVLRVRRKFCCVWDRVGLSKHKVSKERRV